MVPEHIRDTSSRSRERRTARRQFGEARVGGQRSVADIVLLETAEALQRGSAAPLSPTRASTELTARAVLLRAIGEARVGHLYVLRYQIVLLATLNCSI